MTASVRPNLLFILTTDPRGSARPAEAIRVAAGVAAWKKVDITVYLHGPAIRALGEWVDDLKDEDNYLRYLPLLADARRPILVQAGAPELEELGESAHTFSPVDEGRLAELAAQSTAVLRF